MLGGTYWLHIRQVQEFRALRRLRQFGFFYVTENNKADLAAGFVSSQSD